MLIDIITLFPQMFKGPFDQSIISRAQKKDLIKIKIHDLRKWTNDRRGTADDRPYGGGVGMVILVEPIFKVLKELKKKESKTILLSPRGKVWKQSLALQYAKLEHLILICGHYEGVDERVREFIDEEISIGDFILTGGEIPAMVIIDSVTRLITGVLEKPLATVNESFSQENLLEYPHYTQPQDFKGLKVPKILLSGNHAEIAKWRNRKALEITKKNRPELLKK